jgi:hypothetical protein
LSGGKPAGHQDAKHQEDGQNPLDRRDVHNPHRQRTGRQMVREVRTTSQGQRRPDVPCLPDRIRTMFAVYCAKVFTKIDAVFPPLLRNADPTPESYLRQQERP